MPGVKRKFDVDVIRYWERGFLIWRYRLHLIRRDYRETM
jgi:hypothetical protein